MKKSLFSDTECFHLLTTISLCSGLSESRVALVECSNFYVMDKVLRRPLWQEIGGGSCQIPILFLCNRRCACDAYELHGIVESELCYVQMFMEMTFGNPFLQS